MFRQRQVNVQLDLSQQEHEFVANEDRITTEKKCQDQAGTNSAHEHRPRHEHERQDAEARQKHFCHGKHQCTFADDGSHHGINFYGAPVEQLQREECVKTAQQHDAGSQEEQPRMMVVGKKWFEFADPACIAPARTKISEKHGSPRKVTPPRIRSLIYAVLGSIEANQCNPLFMLIRFISVIYTIPRFIRSGDSPVPGHSQQLPDHPVTVLRLQRVARRCAQMALGELYR